MYFKLYEMFEMMKLLHNIRHEFIYQILISDSISCTKIWTVENVSKIINFLYLLCNLFALFFVFHIQSNALRYGLYSERTLIDKYLADNSP